MRFGVAVPSIGAFADPAVAADLVGLAEDLGYDDVWFGDHIVVPAYAAAFTAPEWIEPLTSCIVHLARTTRIRVGTDVLVAPYRHPALVAKMAASADLLTGGRLTLGFGVGYLRGEFVASGAPPYAERGAVTDEYLEVLRLLWGSGGEPVSFAGRYVTLDDVVFGPEPVQSPVPLWVGGNVPAALRRAATHGTGWHPLFPTPEQYAAGRSAILDARGGGDGFTFSMSAALTTLLEDGTVFQAATWGDDASVPDDFGYAPPVPVDEAGRPRFVGTPTEVLGDVQAYAAAGVEHVTLRFSHGGPDAPPAAMAEQLRWFAEAVLPGAATIRPTD